MMLTITEWFDTIVQSTSIRWYAISLVVLGVASALVRARHLLSACVLAVKYFLSRNFTSVIVIPRGYWSSVTMLQVLIFLVFLAANGFCIGYQSRRDLSVVANRCALLSVINMVPLFMAGRSNTIVSVLGLPLHVHHLVHHWVGRISILQAFLHIIFVYSSRTERKQIPSGAITAATLGCLLVFSLTPIRKYMFEVFLKVHCLLALISLGGLLWHVIGVDLNKLIFPILLASLWLFGFVPYLYNWRIRSRDVQIKKFYRVRTVGQHTYREIDVVRVDIELIHPVTIKPGQYVYLRVRGRDFHLSDKFQTHPFMITWWEPRESTRHLQDVSTSKAPSITILVQPANGLTRRISNTDFLQGVSFEGPRGHSLPLEEYENVALVAKGIGLAGILSYAKYIIDLKSDPKRKRKVITRKLDLYWELDDNSQEEWGGPFLKDLQSRNKTLSASIVQIWCYFPHEKTSEPILNLDGYETEFQYFYPDSRFYVSVDDAISGVAANSAGRSIVVACGISSFTDAVRTATLKTMFPSGSIEFVESEYRLSGQTTPRQTAIEATLPAAEKPRARSMKISRPRVNFA